MWNANTLKILVLIVCALRGLLVPDFRYGYVSIGIIQVLFPLTIAAMCCVLAVRSGSMLSAAKFGLIAIALAHLIAVVGYLMHAGSGQLADPVTLSILLASLVAQVAVFLTALFAASLWRRSSH